MVTKKKTTGTRSKKQGNVKVGKLQINKETVKDLTDSEVKGVKGGALPQRHKHHVPAGSANSCI